VDCPGGDTVKRRSKKRGGVYVPTALNTQRACSLS
jgi:hypothetical protein